MSPAWGERLKKAIASVVVLAALVGTATVLGGDGRKSDHWTFLDPASLAELGLVAYGDNGGAWGLEEHEPATGGRALANHEGEPGAPPAVLVATMPKARDVRAKTRCKIVSTSAKAEAFADSPASCGVVFRFVDEQNHWIVRADAGTNTLEAAAVVRGEERVITRAPTPAPFRIGSWIDLVVEVRGDVVRAELDGRAGLVAQAATVPAATGSVGLWVPSGTTVYFDHFTIETLSASPRSLEILPLLGRRPG
ncbi:MAG TPA: hypothetical protein VM925_17150 [Labilithrix sp.]|jgi:hypothetical protein|nr:hypothetical protein [Labilithrix sp.]